MQYCVSKRWIYMKDEKKEKRKLSIVLVLCLLALCIFTGISQLSTKKITDAKPPLSSGIIGDNNNTPVQLIDLLEKKVTINSIEDCTFAWDQWISGEYNSKTGAFCANSSRISLYEFKRIRSKEYDVVLSNTSWIMLISQYDQNGKMLGSTFCVNKMKYKPKENTRYIGVTVYNYKTGSKATYDQFIKELKNGTRIALKSTGITEPDQVPAEPELPEEDPPIITQKPLDDKARFREELKQKIINGDTTPIDLTKYKLANGDTYTIWKDVCATDCRFYANANSIVPLVKSENGVKNSSYYVYGMDADFGPRNQRALKVVNQLITETKGMSDLEKVLYVHDYLVQNTTYNKTQSLTGWGSKILGDKIGKCDGIAQAMISVLVEMDIEAYYVCSSPMDHGWDYVKIDGELYHIDVCWDITRKTASNGANYHRFLLRNDAEMKAINPSHYSFTCQNHTDYKSTSKRFETWFVHDVAGRMYYANGLWYYFDLKANSIVASDIQGNNKQTIVKGGTDSLKLLDVSQGKLTYQKAGTKKTVTLQ